MNEVSMPSTTEGCVTQEWRLSKGELLRNHSINIEFLSVGCIVRVGCMSIPFNFINDAIDAIELYIENPYEEKQKWEKLSEERNN